MANPRSMCPACWWPVVHRLLAISREAAVDYFICPSCLHVWNIPKGHDAPIRHVTTGAVFRLDEPQSA